MLDVPRQQQVIDHVEREQRLHGVIREALARLGEAEEAEALGVAEEGAVVAVALFEIGGGFGDGQLCVLPCGARRARTSGDKRVAHYSGAVPSLASCWRSRRARLMTWVRQPV